MQFGITIPLQKHLKIKTLPYGEQTDLFFCWELHIIKRQEKNMLVAVNASNRFSIIFWGMEMYHWDILEDIMRDGIRQGFLLEGYTEQQINRYFKQAGEISLTKTHGRSPVATLNKMIDYLGYLPIIMNSRELFQVAHCHVINRFLCHAAGFLDYGLPIIFLDTDMKRYNI